MTAVNETRTTGLPFEMVVATATDSNYAWPAVLALLSAAVRASVPLACLLVGDHLTADFLDAAKRVFDGFSIPFEHVDADLAELHSLPTGSHFSRATYGRLRVVGAAGRLARRTLYLDADAVVIGDVAPLTAIALGEGNVIAAVRDHSIRTCSSACGISDWEQRGVDRDAPFFNAGVLLIDNDAWARNDISTRVIDHLVAAPDAATFADQGTLNAVLYGRWLELPWIWNHQIQRSPAVRIGRLAVSRRSCVSLGKARIMHYFQSVKPWDARYPPGALTVLYRRQWASLLPVPEPPRRTYWQWLRKRY